MSGRSTVWYKNVQKEASVTDGATAKVLWLGGSATIPTNLHLISFSTMSIKTLSKIGNGKHRTNYNER